MILRPHRLSRHSHSDRMTQRAASAEPGWSWRSHDIKWPNQSWWPYDIKWPHQLSRHDREIAWHQMSLHDHENHMASSGRIGWADSVYMIFILFVVFGDKVSFGQQISRQWVEESTWGSCDAIESRFKLPHTSSTVFGWQAFGKRYVYRVIDIGSDEFAVYVDAI